MLNFKKNFDIYLCLFLSLIIFCFFGLTTLNIFETDWIFKFQDLKQNYLGWHVYNKENFSFDLFRIKSIGYPIGISLLATDSNPIASFIFKIICHAFSIHDNVQFMGLWVLLCFSLQAVFSVLIFRTLFKNKILIVCSSLFFIIAPSLLYRAFVHVNLCAHFLILIAFYIYLTDKINFRMISLSGLVIFLSLGIHPYFFPMCFAIIISLILKKILSDKEITLRYSIFICIYYLLVIILSFMIFGIPFGGRPTSGYGLYPLNLNALFNPIFDDYSRFLSPMRISEYGYEGLNYLGLGLIILFLVSLQKIKNDTFKNIILQNKYLFYACCCLTILALSNKIYFFNYLVFDYYLPDRIISILGSFRASGRMFWPVWYIIVYFLFYRLTLLKLRNRTLCSIILLCLFIQFIDLSEIIFNKKHYIDNSFSFKKELQLKSKMWDSLLEKYPHIFMEYDPSFYGDFWERCGVNGITANTGYISMYQEEWSKFIIDTRNCLIEGFLPNRDNYIYILNNEWYNILIKNDRLKNHIQSLDNIYYILSDEKLMKVYK